MTTAKSTKIEVPQIEPATEQTPQQIVNAGIVRVIEAHGIDAQKNRYKAMRAIAWQAFADAIEAGTFDSLVTRASANVGALPSGWEIEPPSKAALVTTASDKNSAAR